MCSTVVAGASGAETPGSPDASRCSRSCASPPTSVASSSPASRPTAPRSSPSRAGWSRCGSRGCGRSRRASPRSRKCWPSWPIRSSDARFRVRGRGSLRRHRPGQAAGGGPGRADAAAPGPRAARRLAARRRCATRRAAPPGAPAFAPARHGTCAPRDAGALHRAARRDAGGRPPPRPDPHGARPGVERSAIREDRRGHPRLAVSRHLLRGLAPAVPRRLQSSLRGGRARRRGERRTGRGPQQPDHPSREGRAAPAKGQGRPRLPDHRPLRRARDRGGHDCVYRADLRRRVRQSQRAAAGCHPPASDCEPARPRVRGRHGAGHRDRRRRRRLGRAHGARSRPPRHAEAPHARVRAAHPQGGAGANVPHDEPPSPVRPAASGRPRHRDACGGEPHHRARAARGVAGGARRRHARRHDATDRRGYLAGDATRGDPRGERRPRGDARKGGGLLRGSGGRRRGDALDAGGTHYDPRAGRDRRERDLRALHAHLQPRAGDEGHEVTPVQGAPRRYRLELRLWVMLSVAMALAATASTLAVLYLQRPFIAARGGLAPDAQNALFAAAVAAGGLAGLAGLALGVAWSRRIWAIVARTDAAVPSANGFPAHRVPDELGALDAAVGRLTLSMDRFVSDSDILARLPAAMLLVDDARRLLVFNVTAETLLGPDLARFRGRPLLGVDGPLPVARGNEPLADGMGEAERAGAALHVEEVQASTWSGTPLLLDVTIRSQPGREPSGGSVLLLRDASEKRRIREQIKRADQLALLGGMTARIAHEVRTPLASLRGLVELLQADLADRDRPQEYLIRILQAVERQERLVERLLSFTHPEPESWQPVLVYELLEDLIMAWPGRRPSLTVERPVAPVNGDPVLLSQVFTNLIQNALEASRDREVAVRVSMNDGRVRVTVTNEGAGIPPELHERIFQPFFTTKPGGTGLGLAIARQVVEAHHGAIRVESDGRTATSFAVELPSLRQPAPVAARA